MKNAFNNDVYLQAQKKSILSRVTAGPGRLYLEFGGKLIGDSHAARVLPGYDPDVKMRLLQELSTQADIIVCIHADAIEHRKIRGDLGITYDDAALKLIDDLRARGVSVSAIVITRYNGEPAALQFRKRLVKHHLSVFLHEATPGYPYNLDLIVSPDGFGRNPYIPVSRPLVVVTGPGPCSGKMGTCLSQIYHEFEQGHTGRYAKFETFPVWNLPLSHPINVAYEAATADLRDCNAIDHFHLEAYNVQTVNYNRDLQAFPLLRTLLTRITGSTDGYQSPTDMGVNCIACGIIDDAMAREAAREEVIRRYFQYNANCQLGTTSEETVEWALEILQKAALKPEDRPVVTAARVAARECERSGKGDNGVFCAAAIKLPDGEIVTGKNSTLMHSAASMILNAAKHLTGIPDSQHLLFPEILESVSHFKTGLGTNQYTGLNLSETLIALVVSASRDRYAQQALDALTALRYCDVHLSHIPGRGDEAGLRHLGCSFTYDPLPPTKNLFM